MSKRKYVVAEYMGAIGTVGIRFTMSFSGELITCRVRFNHHGEKIGSTEHSEEFKTNSNGFVHENKLRFVIPMKMECAKGVRDLPFLIEETDDRYIQGNYWTACGNTELGVACFNKGAMCMVREEEGISIPLEYANTYVWGSRMLYGDTEHEFAILPYSGGWMAQDLHRKALAYEYPLAAYPVASGQAGKWNEEVTFLKIEGGENIILSALYPEDGAVIARVYETGGREGSAAISSAFASVDGEVNLLGEDIGASDGNLLLGAHKIHSLKLKKGAGKNG